jgi:hypothetical protein
MLMLEEVVAAIKEYDDVRFCRTGEAAEAFRSESPRE